MALLDMTCVRCGYHWDCADSLQEPAAVPQPGDLTICINCGQAYVLGASKWAPMSDKEIAHLSAQARSVYEALQQARRMTITEDLALKQKFQPKKRSGSG